MKFGEVYLFWDALTRSRTDGALVRLVTPVPDQSSIGEADAELQDFIADFRGVLNHFGPN